MHSPLPTTLIHKDAVVPFQSAEASSRWRRVYTLSPSAPRYNVADLADTKALPIICLTNLITFYDEMSVMADEGR